MKATMPKAVLGRDDKGFTLVETMIGIVIFTVGVMAMAHLQLQSIRNNSLAHVSSDNTHTAMSTIERVNALSWDANETQATDPLTEDQGRLKVDWAITTEPKEGWVTLVNDRNEPSVRLITVTSSYLDQSGVRRSTTLRYIKPRM